MRSRLADAAHVIVPLVAGALVYVAWRSTDVELVTWLPPSVVLSLRATLGKVALPSVVLGSAPDLAWGWAFGAAMGIVWRGRPWSTRKVAWLAAGMLVSAWAEIGQLWQLPPGRFDALDLASIVVGYAIGGALTSRARSPRSTPSPALRPRDRGRSESPSIRG